MLSIKAVLSLLAILVSVDANAVKRDSGKGTIRFAAKVNVAGAANIAELDQARAFQIIQTATKRKRGGVPFSVTNSAVSYIATVGVGSPPTSYDLIVDTGSSNTWVGANKTYVQTSSSQNTGHTVDVSYGSGNFTGEEWIDTVTFNTVNSGSLTIYKQSIGVAKQSNGFSEGVDGILGVGPTDLTRGTVSDSDEIPTVTDNLLSQGSIDANILGVYFVPASNPDNHGELTFGGVNNDAAVSEIEYVPITSTSPASTYWGVDQTITYGGQTILSETAGIVDTGTTLIALASDAFARYQAATGGTMDDNTGLLKISTEQYVALKTLTFTIGGIDYDLTPNAQIWPRALNEQIGGESGAIYLIVTDIGTKSGSGLDFINGYAFLERFYTVYDTDNARVGFARTAYTDSATN
ncbi:acid protease [Leucogyrophana mollusca]|uniref:Acid protease n=1 Tax=Leucogyrophana mollusca TaxID=85980 RepID=A0ACB8AWK3_9AGAM|nr:acid protease [Leucogyrophana mollusca]